MDYKDCPYCDAVVSCEKLVCAKYLAWKEILKDDVKKDLISTLSGNIKTEDMLTIMLNMQKTLQENISKKTGKNITPSNVQELNERMLTMERAIGDELAEIRQHLNWKDWKNPDWDKLNDLTELRKEVIDIFHFVLNMFIITGLSAKDVYEIYTTKNAENVLRQKFNY